MTATDTWKIFSINDYDWYMAPALEEAIQQAMADSGLPRCDAVNEPYELSEADMDRLTFVDDDDVRRTFREELELRLQRGPKVECFASENY